MQKGGHFMSDVGLSGDGGELRVLFEDEDLEEEHSDGARGLPGLQGMDKSVLNEVVLCLVVWFVAVYTTVFQSRALSEEDVAFDAASIMVVSSGASVILAVVWALPNEDLSYFYGMTALKDYATYIPPAICFCVAEYVNMIAYTYLPADNIKVMAQSRIMIIALIAALAFKRKLPTTTWLALGCVTIVAACYVAMKTIDAQREHYHGTLGAFKDAYTDESSELDAEARWGSKTMDQDLAARLQKGVKKFLPNEQQNDSTVGWICVFVYILLGCFGGVYCEVFMKKAKSQPYYIQKTYLNITVILCSVLLSWLLRPVLVRNGIGGDRFKISMFTDGLFYGMGDSRVVGFIVFLTMSGWMKGFLTKRISALAKQIVSVVVVVSLYFMMAVHKCPANEDGGKPFFCFGQLGKLSKYVIVADFAVLAVVAMYVSNMRDQKAIKKEKEAEKERGLGETAPLLQQP